MFSSLSSNTLPVIVSTKSGGCAQHSPACWKRERGMYGIRREVRIYQEMVIYEKTNRSEEWLILGAVIWKATHWSLKMFCILIWVMVIITVYIGKNHPIHFRSVHFLKL